MLFKTLLTHSMTTTSLHHIICDVWLFHIKKKKKSFLFGVAHNCQKLRASLRALDN